MAPQKKAGGAAGAGLRRFYMVLAAVAVVGIAAIAYAVSGGGGEAVTEPIPLAGVEDAQALVAMAKPVAVGEPTAPVKLLVFSDYQCPYCGQFASTVKPLLEANQVKAGTLQILFYDFPLGGGHKHSFVAARAARCAGDQGKYWEYHDLLFGRASQWSPSASTPLSAFEEFAGVLGLDEASFEQCLRSDMYADVVTANRMLGEQLGVNATPTVIINNRRVRNALDYRALAEVIEQARSAAVEQGAGA